MKWGMMKRIAARVKDWGQRIGSGTQRDFFGFLQVKRFWRKEGEMRMGRRRRIMKKICEGVEVVV